MTAIIHNARPRALGSGTQDNEPFLQHFYFIAVIVIGFALVLLRIIVLRRRNQALSNFFHIGGGNSQYSYGSYPPHDSSHGSMYHGIQLSPPPAVYRPDRRIHAADIDPQGRRLGSGGEGLGGKDSLPAYNSLDRPPKYVEAGWPHGPSPLAEQSAATSLPEGQQSGSAQPNTTHVVTGNHVQQSNDTHAMAGPVHENESTTGRDS